MRPDLTWDPLRVAAVVLGVGVIRVGILFLSYTWAWGYWPFGDAPDRIACEDFTFDRERWHDQGEGEMGEVTGRELTADALVRCGTLIGEPRAEVERMLGRTKGKGRSQEYGVGWHNDAIGPGDASWMTVLYDGEDRVTVVKGPRL